MYLEIFQIARICQERNKFHTFTLRDKSNVTIKFFKLVSEPIQKNSNDIYNNLFEQTSELFVINKDGIVFSGWMFEGGESKDDMGILCGDSFREYKTKE